MSQDRKYGPSKAKKRKFCGNQYTNRQKTVENGMLLCDHVSIVSSSLCQLTDTPEKDHEQGATPTRSEQKLHHLYDLMFESSTEEVDEEESDNSSESEAEEDCVVENIGVVDPEGNRIIDVGILSKTVSSHLMCSHCHHTVKFMEIERKGLASKFTFHCSNKHCDKQPAFSSSPQTNVGNASVNLVNRRAAFAMRCIGADRTELKTFCGVMNLPNPVGESSYKAIKNTLHTASREVQKISMNAAAAVEYEQAETISDNECRDIHVSSDRTWMTVGHSSKIGAVTTIGMNTGKVLDTEVKSKMCKSCEYWAKQDPNTEKYRNWAATHDADCTMTHEGSSGSMEASGTCAIFGRSVELYNLRYTGFVGDGDTNTYKKVCDSKPYGDMNIDKLECVGHVQKRVGTRLRSLKKSTKEALPDGKKLSGKGRLTDVSIDKLQAYYGNAIRENKHDIVKMRQAVWAVFFHKGSSDENPVHNFCDVKWCPFLKAKEKGNQYTHRTNQYLPSSVMDAIKPIWKDLTKTELLRKCLGGYTQNQNESINSTIWKLCPKKKNHGLKTVETAVAVAVAVFNDGCTSLMAILRMMDIYPGQFCRKFCEDADLVRKKNAQRQTLLASKALRQARRRRRLGADEKDAERESHPYLAGGY